MSGRVVREGRFWHLLNLRPAPDSGSVRCNGSQQVVVDVDNTGGWGDVAPSLLAMTFEVGDYRSTELIGAGGSAQVWRGLRVSTGVVVAIKVYGADQMAAARREAALAAAVNHQHVVAVLDVVADADRVALITEYAAGGDLADLLADRGRLSAGETLTVLLPLAAALATAHERQIIHGDVSAQNVVFDQAGRPLLADLGAARAAAESGLPVAATPADAAPELARGGPATPATDMFSLGSLALACLTGRHAWPADELSDVVIQAAAGQWPDPGEDVDSPALAVAVRALLDHEPERRPGAASLVLDLRAAGRPEPLGLGRVGRHGLGAASPQSPGPEGERARRVSSDRDGSDAGRLRRSRAITRVRPDAVPPAVPAPAGRRRSTGRSTQRGVLPDGSVRRPRRALRIAVAALTCVLVAALAAAGGLWWARLDRAEPVASGGLGAALSSGAATTAAISTATIGATRRDRPSPVSSASGTHASAGPAGRATGAGLPSTDATASDRVVRTAAGPATATLSPATPKPVDWTATIRALDDARARALVARNAGLLGQVYTADSPARAADGKMIAMLLAGGLRVSDAHHVVRRTLELAGSPTRVLVDDSLPSYPILDSSGKIVGSTTARAAGHRTLVLIHTPAGYRIIEVRAT